jgi:anti-sigma B factor antagonist
MSSIADRRPLPVTSIRRRSTVAVPPVAGTAPTHRAPGDDGRLSVAIKGSETQLVLAVAGDIDAGSHHRFRDALSTVIDRSRNVVLDLGAVDFIDSTGLNGIVWAYHHAWQRGKQLAIRSAPSRVRQLFALTGFERLRRPDGGARTTPVRAGDGEPYPAPSTEIEGACGCRHSAQH